METNWSGRQQLVLRSFRFTWLHSRKIKYQHYEDWRLGFTGYEWEFFYQTRNPSGEVRWYNFSPCQCFMKTRFTVRIKGINSCFSIVCLPGACSGYDIVLAYPVPICCHVFWKLLNNFNWKYTVLQKSQPANKFLRLNVKFFLFELKFYFTAEQLQLLTTLVRFWAFKFRTS